ncbi:aldolase [Microbacterium sediminicola]|uniref:Aldolase n=1 Tax=Microbacterium sediminicola TaxID=415210 RepID=A0ABP4TUZ9_9MICO
MTFSRADRDLLVRIGAALYDRGLTPGRTGNLSLASHGQVLATPSGVSLGRLDPERLSVVSVDGTHLGGDPPTKELPLHLALYRNHPTSRAVAHLHSTHAVAVSCLESLSEFDALPTITPYYAMRVGRLPVVDYAAPGSAHLLSLVESLAVTSRCLLMRNHGSIAAAADLESAADAVEEIEETSRLFLMLEGRRSRPLSDEQAAAIRSE